MCVCVCVCVCVRACVCRNVNQIKTPLINSKMKLTCLCYFCSCQNNNKQMPILGNKAFQIYHKLASTLYIDERLFANKLKCKVQVAVFIFINRVKQQCQRGMRLRQKP